MDFSEGSAFFREGKNMFDMQKVGERIAALRKKTGMTQAELAEWLGISYQAVSSWERGATMPDISKLVELSRALHTTVDALLSGENDTQEPTQERETEQEPHAENEKMAQADVFFGEGLRDMMAQLSSRLNEQMGTMKENLQGLKMQFDGIMDIDGLTIEKKGKNDFVLHIREEKEEPAGGKLNAEIIGAMAWNMDQETLEDVLTDAINDGNDEIVEEIASYLEPETIDRALARAQEPLTLEMVEELAMYMGSGALEECAVHAIDEGQDEMMEEIACHLDDEGMERVLARCKGALNVDMVEALSCHASEKALDLLIEKCDLEDEDVIETLSSYLNQRQLRALLKRLRNG